MILFILDHCQNFRGTENSGAQSLQSNRTQSGRQIVAVRCFLMFFKSLNSFSEQWEKYTHFIWERGISFPLYIYIYAHGLTSYGILGVLTCLAEYPRTPGDFSQPALCFVEPAWVACFSHVYVGTHPPNHFTFLLVLQEDSSPKPLF